MSHNIMYMPSNSCGQNGTSNKVKEEDFLNIFDFSATAENNEESTHEKSPKSHGDYLPHSNNDSTGVSSQSYNTNENFNDLNKLLTNTVGNSEYLDIPFPMVFSNNEDYKQNNVDFDDSGSLMSYTTNNTYTSNHTAGGRRKYSKSINAGVAGSVKSYRSYTADSIDDQMAKERKKQIHNNVEKNRRELIKKKIKELSEIIPISVMKRVAANTLNEGATSSSKVYSPETVDVRKIKYRKRDILCGSVIYIGLLREVVDGVNKKIDKYNVLANKLKERMKEHQSNPQRCNPTHVQRTSRLPDLNDNFDGNLQKLNDDFLELLDSLGNVDKKNQHTSVNTENKNQEPDFESIFSEHLDKINYPIPDNNMNFTGGYDELFKNVMNHTSSDPTEEQKSGSPFTKLGHSNNPSTEGIYEDAFASWLDHS